jgi:hypothetical protein
MLACKLLRALALRRIAVSSETDRMLRVALRAMRGLHRRFGTLLALEMRVVCAGRCCIEWLRRSPVPTHRRNIADGCATIPWPSCAVPGTVRSGGAAYASVNQPHCRRRCGMHLRCSMRSAGVRYRPARGILLHVT